MTNSGGRFIRRRPDVHVKRMGPIEIKVHVGTANVSIPQSQSLVVRELKRAFCVFSEAVKVGSSGW